MRVESLIAAELVAVRISSRRGLVTALGAVANSNSILNADNFVTRVASPLRKSLRALRNANAITMAATGQASALTRATQGEDRGGGVGCV
jgi:hypothetical protein